ncbi:MAG TPA: cytochrome b/b6 domain-containing protein [Longimicrobium sp.]|nr:cytochrome b/b6 domain-containing protein [Longimicrobium sp.]
MNATAAPAARPRRHHWIVRATHWVNAVALTLMVGSGLRIFNAYPMFARKGETFCCWPWEGTAVPAWLTFGGWLAGARNWHFAMMWVLAVNGAIYLAFIWLHGEWRDLAPRRGDVRDAWEMIKFYLFIRKKHPRQGKHNALQKGVYFALPWLGVLAVLTGLAIWKPVQLAPLTDLFGGYVWARYWHFMVMLALVLLGLGHVFMVFAVDPASLVSMVTGRYDESRSPEARNARPFLRGRPKPVLTIVHPPSTVTIDQPAAEMHASRPEPPHTHQPTTVERAEVSAEQGDLMSPPAVRGDADAREPARAPEPAPHDHEEGR